VNSDADLARCVASGARPNASTKLPSPITGLTALREWTAPKRIRTDHVTDAF
jgi:hypothetical protein